MLFYFCDSESFIDIFSILFSSSNGFCCNVTNCSPYTTKRVECSKNDSCKAASYCEYVCFVLYKYMYFFDIANIFKAFTQQSSHSLPASQQLFLL